jgi:cytochrome c2
MPAYHFRNAQLNGLVKYFSYLDNQDFPFADVFNPHAITPESLAAGEKLFSKEYFGCTACHIVGNSMPGGSPDSWAPDFAIAKARLKPEWIVKWLINPQELLPGTKMPGYFDPKNFENSGPEDVLNGDEHAQIRALRNYIFTLSNGSSTTAVQKSGARPVSGAAAASTPAVSIEIPTEPKTDKPSAPAISETKDASGDDFWAEEPAKK